MTYIAEPLLAATYMNSDRRRIVKMRIQNTVLDIKEGYHTDGNTTTVKKTMIPMTNNV